MTQLLSYDEAFGTTDTAKPAETETGTGTPAALPTKAAPVLIPYSQVYTDYVAPKTPGAIPNDLPAIPLTAGGRGPVSSGVQKYERPSRDVNELRAPAPVALKPEFDPNKPQEPGIFSVAGRSALGGLLSGGQSVNTTAALVGGTSLAEKIGSQKFVDPDIQKLLDKPLTSNWTNPKVLVSHMLYGLASSYPMVTSALIGGGLGAAATSETGPGAAAGAIVGGAAGAGFGAALQTLGPAFVQAKAENPKLSNEEAFNIAWEKTGIAASAGALSGALGPIKNQALQIFIAQPAVMMFQTAANNFVDGKPTTIDDLANAYLEGASIGTAFGVIHAAPDLVKKTPAIPVIPEVSPEQREALKTIIKPPVDTGERIVNAPGESNDGNRVTIDPDQKGVTSEGMTRVITADGKKVLIGKGLLSDANEVPQSTAVTPEQKAALSGKAITPKGKGKPKVTTPTETPAQRMARLKAEGKVGQGMPLVPGEVPAGEALAAPEAGATPPSTEPLAPTGEAPVTPEGNTPEAAGDTLPTVPDTQATLEQQAKDLADPKNDRKVMFIPTDTLNSETFELPDALSHPDIGEIRTKGGTLFYDTNTYTGKEVRKQFNAGKLNDLLQMGPSTKADVAASVAKGNPELSVTEKTPEGVDVKNVAGTPETAPEQIAALNATKGKGNTVGVEPSAEVLAKRLAENQAAPVDEAQAAAAELAKNQAGEPAAEPKTLEGYQTEKNALEISIEIDEKALSKLGKNSINARRRAEITRRIERDKARLAEADKAILELKKAAEPAAAEPAAAEPAAAEPPPAEPPPAEPTPAEQKAAKLKEVQERAAAEKAKRAAAVEEANRIKAEEAAAKEAAAKEAAAKEAAAEAPKAAAAKQVSKAKEPTAPKPKKVPKAKTNLDEVAATREAIREKDRTGGFENAVQETDALIEASPRNLTEAEKTHYIKNAKAADELLKENAPDEFSTASTPEDKVKLLARLNRILESAKEKGFEWVDPITGKEKVKGITQLNARAVTWLFDVRTYRKKLAANLGKVTYSDLNTFLTNEVVLKKGDSSLTIQTRKEVGEQNAKPSGTGDTNQIADTSENGTPAGESFDAPAGDMYQGETGVSPEDALIHAEEEGKLTKKLTPEERKAEAARLARQAPDETLPDFTAGKEKTATVEVKKPRVINKPGAKGEAAKAVSRADVTPQVTAPKVKIASKPAEKPRTTYTTPPKVKAKPVETTPEPVVKFAPKNRLTPDSYETGKPFVADVLHGTSTDINSWDKGMRGATTKAGSAKEAFFFGAEPQTANGYAEYDKVQQQQREDLGRALVKRFNGESLTEFEQQLIDDMNERAAENKAGKALLDDVTEKVTSGEIKGAETTKAAQRLASTLGPTKRPNIQMSRIKLDNPLVVDQKGSRTRQELFSSVIARAKAAGHDGVVWLHTFDVAGKTKEQLTDADMDTVYAVFEPDQISQTYRVREEGQIFPMDRDAGERPADLPKETYGNESKYATETITVDELHQRLTSEDALEGILDTNRKFTLEQRAAMAEAMPKILEQLRAIVGKVKVYVLPDADFDMFKWEAQAYYNKGGDYIAVRESALEDAGNAAHVGVHEVTHAAIEHAIEANPKLKEQLTNLFTAVRNQMRMAKMSEAGIQGFKNIHEFLSEAMSNPKFQELLASIKIRESKITEWGIKPSKLSFIKNAWDAVTSFINDTLGLEDILVNAGFRPSGEAKQTAFSAAMDIAGNLLEVAPQARADFYAGGKIKTDTPKFKKWFRKSKVVTPEGKPLVVYHGTGKSFTAFMRSAIGSAVDYGWVGEGFYFTNRPDIADYYANRGAKANLGRTPNVIPTYLSLQNPFMWEGKSNSIVYLQQDNVKLPAEIHDEVVKRAFFKFYPDAPYDKFVERDLARAVTDVLREKGYDGVIVTKNGEPTEFVAFDPTQIKSTFNTGEFDGSNPDIRMMERTPDEVESEFTKRGVPDRLARDLAKAAKDVFGDSYTLTKADYDAMMSEFSDVISEARKKVAATAAAKAAPGAGGNGKKVTPKGNTPKTPKPQGPPAPVVPPLKIKLRTALQKVFDKFWQNNGNVLAPLEVLRNQIEKARKAALPDEARFDEKMRLKDPKADARVNKELTEASTALAALDAKAKAAGFNTNEFDRGLVARHAPDVNKFLLKEKDVKDGSGMSNKEAADILTSIAADPQKAALFKEYVDLAKKLRDKEHAMMLEYGTADQAAIDSMNKSFPNYVSLSGFADDAIGEAMKSRGGYPSRKETSLIGRETISSRGRTTESDRPIYNMSRNVGRAIVRGESNLVGQSLEKAIELSGWTEKEGPMYVVRSTAAKQINNIMSARQNPNVIGYKVNGEQRYIVVRNEYRDIADVIDRTPRADIPGLFKLVNKATNILKGMYTYIRPDFLIKHNVRFVQEGGMNLQALSKYGIDTNPVKFASNAASSMRQIYRYLQGKEVTDPTAKKYIELMEKSGAITRSIYDDILTRDQFEELAKGPSAGKVKAFTQAYMNLSHSGDMAQRLETFRLVYDKTGSEQKAAIAARDILPDPARRGKWSPYQNVWSAFSGIAIRTAELTTKNLIKSGRYRKVVGAMVLGSAAASLANYYLGGKDKDGRWRYDLIPEYVKRTNLVVMLPSDHADGSPEYLTLPMSPAHYAFKAIGDTITDIAMHIVGDSHKNASHITKNVLLSTAESFTPFGHQAENPLMLITPEALRPLMEIYGNKDNYGNPIYTQYPRAGVPASEQGMKSTAEGWKTTAKVMAKVGIDTYPEVYKHIYGATAGSAVNSLAGIGAIPYKLATEGTGALKENPISNVFVGKSNPNAYKDAFYTNLDKIKLPVEQTTAVRHMIAGTPQPGDKGIWLKVKSHSGLSLQQFKYLLGVQAEMERLQKANPNFDKNAFIKKTAGAMFRKGLE